MVFEIKAGKLAMSMASAAMILSATAPAGATQPGEPREDRFDRSTVPQAPMRGPIHGHVSSVRINPPAPAANVPHPEVSKDSSPHQWFTAMDTYVGFYRPSDQDKIDMTNPFHDEAENVAKFCKTVSKIAKNYRALALKLKSLPISTTLPDQQKVREYRDSLARWYNDSASVYEDMIRPRPPARTKEELQSMIKDIQDRSESLKSVMELLQKMDSDIRLSCHVDPPHYDDAIKTFAGPQGYAGKK